VDVLLIGAEQEWGLNDRATVQRPREWRRGMVERRLSLGEGGIAALDRRFERASGSFGARAPTLEWCAHGLDVRPGLVCIHRLACRMPAGMVVITVSSPGRERCRG
jgi:hypothetical protein